MKTFFSAIFISLMSVFHCNAQSQGIDRFIQSQMDKKGIPGLQLAVVRQGQIVKTGSYGIANVEDSIAVDSKTVFALNSITKAFTGVAVMQLVEQEKLMLDNPVSDYLEDLPSEWKSVTVRQLMTHTSGLPEIMDYNTNLISNKGEEASWQKVQQLPMQFAPGEAFQYNQTNYLLIGRIIQKLSGIPFTRFIQKNQLEKINASLTLNAGFEHYEGVITHSARGYTYTRTRELKHVHEKFTPALRAAAGMSSTAEELATWVIALQEGKLFDNETSLSQLWTVGKLNNGQFAGFNKRINGYAIGWPMVRREEHPAATPIGGGRSAIFVYPEDDMAVIVLTNLQGASPENFIDEIAGFYIPEMKAENGFGLPANVKKLRKPLEKNGYEDVLKSYEKMKDQDKDFTLTESEVNSWGYQLTKLNQSEKALAIFKLNVALYPESSNVYDSLGEIYAIMGNIELAKQNYKHSLELNPENTNAVRMLDRIEAFMNSSKN